MTRFSFNNIRKKAIEAYENEVGVSRGIQDEVKVYNERFPRSLEPLAQLGVLIDEYEQGLFTSSGNIGEFNEGMVAGDTHEEKAWSFFLNKGYNKKAIAGIMGNFEAESGINPTNIQGGGKGPGTGLIQWEDGYSGRWNQLEKWASEKGKDKWSIETQLDYLWLEMTNGSHDTYWSRAGRTLGVDLSGSKEVPAQKFGKISNIEIAMKAFELTIERAGIKAYAKRLKYANNFYEKYKDWAPGAAGASGMFLEPHRNASYTVTSEYGYRIHPIYGTRRLHGGIDLSSSSHTSLYTVASGKVVQVAFDAGGWGNYVVISHGVIGAKEVYSLYAHMKEASPLKTGQSIPGNAMIGIEGTTGSSTGIHLHLEIREGAPGGNWSTAKEVDPRNYITFK